MLRLRPLIATLLVAACMPDVDDGPVTPPPPPETVGDPLWSDPATWAPAPVPVAGTAVTIHVTGEAGGAWSIVRESARWRLYRGAAPRSDVTMTIEPDAAWRLLYNALSAREAKDSIGIEGDASLAEPVFMMRTVMV